MTGGWNKVGLKNWWEVGLLGSRLSKMWEVDPANSWKMGG